MGSSILPQGLGVRQNIKYWGDIPLTGRDISLDLAELSKKYSAFTASSGRMTVPANSTVDWHSYSGVGMFYLHQYHYSSGIPASNAKHDILLDGTLDRFIQVPDVFHAYVYGFTTVGNYSLGAKAFRIGIWDTTNNVYELTHFSESFPIHFKSSLTARFWNTNTTTSATMYAWISYFKFISSKVIYAKMLPQAEIHNALSLKHKLLREGIRADAIVIQRLGYYEEELPPIMQEFPKDLPNESDDKCILPDRTIVKSRKHNTAHQVVEIHVDESVSTDKVLSIIKPMKFLKEEVY